MMFKIYCFRIIVVDWKQSSAMNQRVIDYKKVEYSKEISSTHSVVAIQQPMPPTFMKRLEEQYG